MSQKCIQMKQELVFSWNNDTITEQIMNSTNYLSQYVMIMYSIQRNLPANLVLPLGPRVSQWGVVLVNGRERAPHATFVFSSFPYSSNSSFREVLLLCSIESAIW